MINLRVITMTRASPTTIRKAPCGIYAGMIAKTAKCRMGALECAFSRLIHVVQTGFRKRSAQLTMFVGTAIRPATFIDTCLILLTHLARLRDGCARETGKVVE